jgi:M6 family metalloprotease-like protein
MRIPLLLPLLLAMLSAPLWVPGVPAEAFAQDVEMLGRYYGNEPPAAYYEELARDPRAFRFEREGRERLLHMQQWRGTRFPDVILRYGPAARSIGPRDVPMVGDFHFPLVLGLFADTPGEPEYGPERVQTEYFDGPNSYHQTITELFREMSGGRVELEGTTFPWVRTDLTADEVTRGVSGLSAHSTDGVGAFVEQIVEALDGQGVDWSRFDNTGDGFVDVLAVMHPTSGAECTRDPNKIWSHRWTVRSATRGRLDPGIPTSTPNPNGTGYIYVNDYTIQPVLACRSTDINQIGVFAHELGHGFGLPDLYATHGSHGGTGPWDLMGTGGWGCRGTDPSRPCHLGAWSKAVLGWVDVTTLSPDTDHGTILLPPVIGSGEVLRIDAVAGSREFLLLENRQRVGSEADLWEPGLLIWHVDQDMVDARWTSNTVNQLSDHMGVWLRQADGLDLLAVPDPQHHFGDPGDPFPGCIQDDPQAYQDGAPCLRSNHEFHAGSDPAARGHGGNPFGVTIRGIDLVGSAPHDVRFDLSTRRTRIALEVEGEGGGPSGSFLLDGEPVPGDPPAAFGFPFDRRILEAPPGGEIAEGVRVGFLGWADGAPRIREIEIPPEDSELAARYGGEEVRLLWEPTADGGNIEPGLLDTDPGSVDLWFPRGTEVTVEARARTGFEFQEWTGRLTGEPNPTFLSLDEPKVASARFGYLYRIGELPHEVEMEAAQPHLVGLSVEEGQNPIQWTVIEGDLPAGLLIAQSAIQGAALEMGEFPLRIRARDAQGLEATAEVLIRVGPPVIGMDRLTGPFLDTGVGPTQLQRNFLDRLGNGNGAYDVADLRAFLRVVPDVPEETPAAAGQASLRETEIRLPAVSGDGTTPRSREERR